MRWQSHLAVIIIACAVAVPVQAEIILEASPATDLGGGLLQIIVSATGTEGEQISHFSDLSVTGRVHQVWRATTPDPLPTPTIDEATPSANFHAFWAAYDSHLLIASELRIAPTGTFLKEANDLSTTGTIGLPMVSGMEAPSGFGEITDDELFPLGFSLAPELVGSVVPLFQVVTTPGTAYVSATIGAEGGIEQRIETFEVGRIGGDFDPPVVNLVDYGTYHIDDDPDPLWIPLDALEEESLPVVWSGLTYDSGPGKNTDFSGQDDGLLTDDGVFHWDPRGWRQGVHFFSAIATDSANPSNASQLTTAVRVDLWVPEPATASLLGLALLGLVGFTRRRG